jgi:predicted ATPase
MGPRPPWKLRSHHGVISLAPLDAGEVARMVGEIASRHALSKDVIAGVSERSGGVPLFVEEVTRLLLERGEHGARTQPIVLAFEDLHWADPTSLGIRVVS